MKMAVSCGIFKAGVLRMVNEQIPNQRRMW
jgi:hypothetical protein